MDTTPDPPEPLTLDNAYDVLRSWAWLYEGLQRPDGTTDEQVAAGAEKGRNRQCSIGWHEECSDRSGINHRGECTCVCHQAEWERVGNFMRWLDECLQESATITLPHLDCCVPEGYFRLSPVLGELDGSGTDTSRLTEGKATDDA